MNLVVPSAPARAWVIVRVHAGSEHLAAADLIGMGFTVFAPHHRKKYRHNRSKAVVVRFNPLLRGYLFVMASHHWTRIKDGKKVLEVLCDRFGRAAEQPIWIDDAYIETVRKAQDAGHFDQMFSNEVQVGEAVRITEGAFAGIIATVESAGDTELTVMLNVLGRGVKTRVPLEILKKAG